MSIIERNSKGEVAVDGKSICRIPEGISMLAILGNNPLFEGATYGDDSMIHAEGRMPRKWFLQHNDTTYWPQILKDIPRLEARYFKVLQAQEKYHREAFIPAFNAVLKVKTVHCKPTHNYDGSKHWWEYDGCDGGISFSWIDAPVRPKNLKIGQTYYEVDNRMMQLYTRTHRFFDILLLAISSEKILPQDSETETFDTGSIYILNINSRPYVFQAHKYPHGYIQWKFLSSRSNVITTKTL